MLVGQQTCSQTSLGVVDVVTLAVSAVQSYEFSVQCSAADWKYSRKNPMESTLKQSTSTRQSVIR